MYDSGVRPSSIIVIIVLTVSLPHLSLLPLRAFFRTAHSHEFPLSYEAFLWDVCKSSMYWQHSQLPQPVQLVLVLAVHTGPGPSPNYGSYYSADTKSFALHCCVAIAAVERTDQRKERP